MQGTAELLLLHSCTYPTWCLEDEKFLDRQREFRISQLVLDGVCDSLDLRKNSMLTVDIAM